VVAASVTSPPVRKRTFLIPGLFVFAVFLFWWSAWRPGFIDADAIDRLSRLHGFELTTDDPPLYTAILWLISLGGRSAALATFLQGAAWATVAGVWSVRLNALGAHPWVAGISVGVVGLLPAVVVGMLGLWLQSVLALAAAWLLTELAASEWTGKRTVRSGIAIGLVAALGLVGLIAAAVVATVLLMSEHSPPASAARQAMAIAVGIGLVGWLVLPLGMTRGRSETPVIAAVVASALTHHTDDFPQGQIAELTAVAPLEVWQELYDCADPTFLTRDREFDAEAISANRWRAIGFGAFARNPFTAIGQRLCATVSLMTPALPGDSRYYLPAYTVYPNDIGVEREPLLSLSLDSTKAVLIRSQQADRLVWWWRPALPIAVAGLAYVLLAIKRRRMALGAALLVGLLAGTFVAGPLPEFQVALPLYLTGWMSATLLTTLRRT